MRTLEPSLWHLILGTWFYTGLVGLVFPFVCLNLWLAYYCRWRWVAAASAAVAAAVLLLSCWCAAAAAAAASAAAAVVVVVSLSCENGALYRTQRARYACSSLPRCIT